MTLEDFTTYTEVDPNNHIEKTATHIDADLYTNEDAYLYKDFGAGYFQNFIHFIDLYVDASTSFGRGNILVLSKDTLDDFWGLITTGKTAIGVYVYYVPGVYQSIYLGEAYNGQGWGSDPYMALFDTWYYLKFIKLHKSLTLKIYPTAVDRANNTNVLATLSLALHADHSFRYVMPVDTFAIGGVDYITLDVENLVLQEMKIHVGLHPSKPLSVINAE